MVLTVHSQGQGKAYYANDWRHSLPTPTGLAYYTSCPQAMVNTKQVEQPHLNIPYDRHQLSCPISCPTIVMLNC